MMRFINHEIFKRSVTIYIVEEFVDQIDTFFSMFCITKESIGYTNVGTFILNIKKAYVQLVFNDITYIFGSVMESCVFIADVIQVLFSVSIVGNYHGAMCLDKNGNAIALIAKSMVGKTTLNMFLCKNGYKYLSDDIILINDMLKVIPMPVAVKIRRGILYDDPYYQRFTSYKNEDYKVLTGLGENIAQFEYNLKSIVFLYRDNQLDVHSMTSSELLISLLPNVFHVNDWTNQLLFSKRLAKQIHGYNLYYDKLDKELLIRMSEL